MEFPVGTLTIGSDLKVRWLGFGAMRITGRGIWGEDTQRHSSRRVGEDRARGGVVPPALLELLAAVPDQLLLFRHSV